jgi:hypothetical protein
MCALRRARMLMSWMLTTTATIESPSPWRLLLPCPHRSSLRETSAAPASGAGTTSSKTAVSGAREVTRLRKLRPLIQTVWLVP